MAAGHRQFTNPNGQLEKILKPTGGMGNEKQGKVRYNFTPIGRGFF